MWRNTCFSEKLACKEIFAWGEVIKAFNKTKENKAKHKQDGDHLAEALQKYPCLYEKGNKGYKERERSGGKWLENSWAVFTVESSLPSQKVHYTDYLKCDSPSLTRFSCKKLWSTKLPFLFLVKNISPHVLFIFLFICSW